MSWQQYIQFLISVIVGFTIGALPYIVDEINYRRERRKEGDE